MDAEKGLPPEYYSAHDTWKSIHESAVRAPNFEAGRAGIFRCVNINERGCIPEIPILSFKIETFFQPFKRKVERITEAGEIKPQSASYSVICNADDDKGATQALRV
jgi:hypothetical protein